MTRWLVVSSLLAAGLAAAEETPKNVLALPTSWKDESGKSVSLETFKGRWYALTFVYTSCAGSCPLTTKKLKRLDAVDVPRAARLQEVVGPVGLAVPLEDAGDEGCVS